MKKTSLRSLGSWISAISLGLCGAGVALAQTGSTAPATPVARSASASADLPLHDGVVKKINKSKGSITLMHGALSNGMPAMTMTYRVRNTTLLDKLAVGQKVRFAIDPADSDMVVNRLEPVQ